MFDPPNVLSQMESRGRENTNGGYEIFVRPLVPEIQGAKVDYVAKIEKMTRLQFSCYRSANNHPNGMPLGTIVADERPKQCTEFGPDKPSANGKSGHFPAKKCVEKFHFFSNFGPWLSQTWEWMAGYPAAL